MSDETTTEQLAEIEEQAEDTPATEYTPPAGWRVLQVGERLRDGDMTVRKDGYCYSTERVGGWVGSNQRYIRPIEPEQQPEPQPQPEPEPDTDEKLRRLQAAINNRMKLGGASQTRVELQGRIRELETIRDTQAATIEELRSEVSYVQNLLGESRQRITQLEELVASLRTINEAQEKAFTAAGKENTALRNQLTAVKTELASVAADRQRLRIELDAAQQVPADSPELRQLRADLAEVIQERDTYRHAHERVLSDLETIRETTKAETVEAIAEWLDPIRGCNSPSLALLLLEALPSIMRHLTGLTPED